MKLSSLPFSAQQPPAAFPMGCRGATSPTVASAGVAVLPAAARRHDGAERKRAPSMATPAAAPDAGLLRRARNTDLPPVTPGNPSSGPVTFAAGAPLPALLPSTVVHRLGEEPTPFERLQPPVRERLDEFFAGQALKADSIAVMVEDPANPSQAKEQTLAESYRESVRTGQAPTVISAQLQPGRYASALEALDLQSILDDGSTTLTPGAMAERIQSYWRAPSPRLGAPSRQQWLGHAMSQSLLDETRARIQTGELPAQALAVATAATRGAPDSEDGARSFTADPQRSGLAAGTVILTAQGVRDPGQWWGPQDRRCPAPGPHRNGGATTVNDCDLPWNVGQPQEGGLTLLWEPGKPLRSYGSLNALQDDLRRQPGQAQARLVLTPNASGSAGDARMQQLQAQQISQTRAAVDTARSEGQSLEQTKAAMQKVHTRTLQKAGDTPVAGMMDARLRDEADAATRSGRLGSKGAAIVEHALTRPAGEEDRRVALVSEGGALQRGTVVMTEHPWQVSRGMLDGGRIVVWEPGQPLREHASYGAFNEFLRLRAGTQAMQPNMSLRAGTPGQLRLEQEWADRAKPVPPHPDLLALTLRPAPPAEPREAQLLPALQQPDRPGEGALKAELRTAMNQESALRQGIAAGEGGQALQQLDPWGRRESILEFARARLRPALKDQTGQELDPDRIRIRAEFRSEPIAGEGTIARGTTPHGQRIQPPPVTLSLTEWSLHNTGDLTSRSTRTVTVTDDQGRPIPGLSVNDVVAVIQKVDIGKTYPAQIKDRLLHSDAGKALRTQHRDLMLAGMRSDASAAQLNGHFLADRTHRGLHWVRAVIDHPEQAGRPPVEGQTITANALYLNDTPIPGVMIIRPQHERSVPSVVVHTPGAPDGIAFKEYENLQAARRDLMIRPGMKAWMVSQVPTSAQEGVRRELDAGRAQPGRLPVLQPIQGNVADYLYERKVESAIVEVSRTTVSNDDRRNDTLADGIGTGITLLKTLMGFVPFAGTLISVTEGAMHLAEGLDHRQKGDTAAARKRFAQAAVSAIQAGASFVGDAALGAGAIKTASRPLATAARPVPGTAVHSPAVPAVPMTTPKQGSPIVRLSDGRIGIPLSPVKPPRLPGGAGRSSFPTAASALQPQNSSSRVVFTARVPEGTGTATASASSSALKRKSSTISTATAAKMPKDIDSPTYRMPTIEADALPAVNASNYNEILSRKAMDLVRERFKLFGSANKYAGDDARQALADLYVSHVQATLYQKQGSFDFTLAMQKQAGNCGEMSGSAAQIVKMSSPATPVAQYRIGNEGAHAFAITGRPARNIVPGKGDVDFANTADDVWVMDPWAGLTVRARDYPVKFREQMTIWDLEGRTVTHNGEPMRPTDWYDKHIAGQNVHVNIPYHSISSTSSLPAGEEVVHLGSAEQDVLDDFDLDFDR